MKFHRPDRVWTIKHYDYHQYFITDIERNDIFKKEDSGYHCVNSYQTLDNFRHFRYIILDDILKLGIK